MKWKLYSYIFIETLVAWLILSLFLIGALRLSILTVREEQTALQQTILLLQGSAVKGAAQ